MSDTVIKVENLSKSYQIRHQTGERYTALRDVLANGAKDIGKRLLGRNDSALRAQGAPVHSALEEFWALNDVSFEVKQGERVGIIGRNGAGKSTLLKILSRITEPTKGRIHIKGRVASLLEVGTGFHPELTGRENISLNGAILGMSREEIRRKFDEIVAFAEVEKFLDTPVKRYSSGMYVRLAFAVAAHLEPEILVVDEVLAVGDAAFQKKCLGKMNEIAEIGRTVLFVSHNLAYISQLCPQALLLCNGNMVLLDSSDAVIKRYMTENIQQNPAIDIDPNTKASAAIILKRCWIGDETATPIKAVDVVKGFTIGLSILVRKALSNVKVSLRIKNSLSQPIIAWELATPIADLFQEKGIYTFTTKIPGHFFAPDTYCLTIAIHQPNIEILDNNIDILNFVVEETGSQMSQYSGKRYGNIIVQFPWHLVDAP